MEWQPLETTPLDEFVLVCDKKGNIEIDICQTKKETLYRKIEGNLSQRMEITKYVWKNSNPTHWMPLPEPPK